MPKTLIPTSHAGARYLREVIKDSLDPGHVSVVKGPVKGYYKVSFGDRTKRGQLTNSDAVELLQRLGYCVFPKLGGSLDVCSYIK